MSPVLPPRAPRAAARATGVALALALGLSGCGAGLRAQTYQERTTSDSTNEAVGALAIRHLRVLPPSGGADSYPAGSDARVAMIVVNEGTEPDRLTSVTTDGAARVDVLASNGRPTTFRVDAQSTQTGATLVLRGLTRELRPGNYVRLDLVFAVNGTLSTLVPVEVTNSPAPRRTGYDIPEPDSEGNVQEEQEGPSGADVPEKESDPIGDGNGGADAATPPPGR